MPTHTHSFKYANKVTNNFADGDCLAADTAGYWARNYDTHKITTDSVGTSKAHENRPPYYALAYIMKIQEVYRKIDLEVVTKILTLLAGIITSSGIIIAFIKKYIDKNLIKPIVDKIDNLELEQAKNYLLEFLCDKKQGEPKTEYQIQRAHEVYDRYKKLNGNSYIKHLWTEVMENVTDGRKK